MSYLKDYLKTHPDDLNRLAAKLTHRVLPSGCWEFTGYILPVTGYGQLGRNTPAHRVAWFKEHGQLPPKGMQVDHTCHNKDLLCMGGACVHRRCVNPAHLEAVTLTENVMRGRGFGAANAAKTECVNGHPFSSENTVISSIGKRVCITCRRNQQRASYGERAEKLIAYQNDLRRARNPRSYAIREWAQAQGLQVSMSGPIARAVVEAYDLSTKAT